MTVTCEFPASEENYKPQNASWPPACKRYSLSRVPVRFEGESLDMLVVPKERRCSIGLSSPIFIPTESHTSTPLRSCPVLMMITHPTLFPCLFNF